MKSILESFLRNTIGRHKMQDTRRKTRKGIFSLESRILSLESLMRLLVCVAMGAMVIMPLSAQDQDKGFVVRERSEGLVHSIASAQGTRWALLVGIAKYPSVEGFEIQQLKAPVKDVNALAAFLKDPEKGGFNADHVFMLTDAEATKREILMTFNDIAKRAAPEDMVLFYFSGHGIPPDYGESTYLVPYDHDLRDVETTCINFGDLSRKIRRMEASKVVVILDACHSGGVKAKDARSGMPKGLYEGYIKAFQESEGRPLLLSSGESEVSWETEQYGIFTHFLLEGLSGEADTDNDGIVTFTEVSEFVRETVKRHTSENFPRVQEPTVRFLPDPVRGDIPLAINWRKVARQRQQDLLDKRNTAIYQAVSAGLDQVLKDFSLRVAKSAYDKALKGEELTEREFLLSQEIDALKDGTITAADYITRARAICNLGQGSKAAAAPTLKPEPKPATIVAPDLPDGVSVLINGESAALPYELPPGAYRIRLERDGFQSVQTSGMLKPAQVLSLHPEWIAITPLRPPTTPVGIPPTKALAASLAVPGLGQHLQRRHVRGLIYEATTIGAGAVALWAAINYRGALDDYNSTRDRLRSEAKQISSLVMAGANQTQLTSKARDLLAQQKDAYDEAKSARTLSIATQIALGVVWGINALDAGIMKPAQQSSTVALGAYPTSDGAQVLVRAPF